MPSGTNSNLLNLPHVPWCAGLETRAVRELLVTHLSTSTFTPLLYLNLREFLVPVPCERNESRLTEMMGLDGRDDEKLS